MFVTRFLLYALLILFILRALGRLFAGIAQGMGHERKRVGRSDGGVRMVRDPVCGTFVIPANALAIRDAKGLHHFCSQRCRDAFVARAQP